MRFSSLFGPAAAEIATIILAFHAASTQGVNFTPVPSPNLDLSQLGRVALAGDFDSISLYTYREQNENSYNTNGSQALLTQLPNGAFATLAAADASIATMCPFILQDGTFAGIVVGGNFTSLGGIEAQGVAMFNPSTGGVTALPGLSGQVYSLLCDQETNTVYVGGEFKGASSTNAIAWVGMTGWSNLPFAGFNGPVRSIAKAPGGNAIFGGEFTGLGNTTAATPTSKDQQIINLSSANISAVASSTQNGFSDPKNIVCKTNGQDGSGNTWLLDDNTPGAWKADLNFGFQPTKLRLYNTRRDGRGTRIFRFTANPINGIMNLTYTDPVTKAKVYCDSRCPLSNDAAVPYQDFEFVNVIGMNAFRIDISEWYGKGGGLDGVELFENDIFAYAVPALNEPACINTQYGANSTVTGPWTVTPSGKTNSQYLTANLTGPNIGPDSASVVFKPDIKQSGNYTVTIYTPGCKQDSSCDSRGIANITGTFTSGSRSAAPNQTTIYQTNDFDKYDQIYKGFVDASTGSFRPTVTLAPVSGQDGGIALVAQRVRFELESPSGGGLNGLFEFNPNRATVDTDFSTSKIDTAGTDLDTGALITSLAVIGVTTYVAGNFSTKDYKNIFSIVDGNVTSLPAHGLDAAVTTFFVYGNILYVGGNFTDTVDPSTPGLQGIGAFDTSKNVWQPLGSGVNGKVNSIVPLSINITKDQPETCISINGDFHQVQASGSNKAFAVNRFAIWVPSRKEWLQNLNIQTLAINGQLSVATNVTNSAPVLAGTLSSQGMSIGDAIELTSSPNLTINPLGVKIQPKQLTQSSIHKRAVSGQNVTGAVVGLFDKENGRNLTIVGGHFSATATNGSTIENLAIINNTQNSDQSIITTVTGVGRGPNTDSVFLALATQGDTLFAGGTVTGKVNNANINGLILWNLAQGDYAPSQPQAFVGQDVAVNAISQRPSTTDMYVAGNFDNAGALSCPSICVYQSGQWTRPGTGFGGSVSALTWQGNDKLLVGGNLTVGGSATTLANYDAAKQIWSPVSGASDVPGPVTALSPANQDASQYWVAGKSTNGSAFLMKYDGSKFLGVGDSLGKQSTIRGLSVVSLSQNHDDSDFLPADMDLLITGSLNLPAFGNASAALFNGSTFSPFILSTSGNAPGSLSQFFTERVQSFSNPEGHMKLGFVILIALAIAAALVCLLVAAGYLIERGRRRKEGYRPAPQNYYEKTANMDRIRPEQLFGTLGRGKGEGRVDRL